MSRTRWLVASDRYVDLLGGGANIEPREATLHVHGDGARGQAEDAAIEGLRVVEGARGDEKVDVGDAGDHGWVVGGRGEVWMRCGTGFGARVELRIRDDMSCFEFRIWSATEASEV